MCSIGIRFLLWTGLNLIETDVFIEDKKEVKYIFLFKGGCKSAGKKEN